MPVLLLLFFLGVSARSSTYTAGLNNYFHPSQSSSFKLVKMGNVNVTFLDKSNLLGYDGEEYVKVCDHLMSVTKQLGSYRVKTRLGLVTECNSDEFDTVDGILGSILHILSSHDEALVGPTSPEVLHCSRR